MAILSLIFEIAEFVIAVPIIVLGWLSYKLDRQKRADQLEDKERSNQKNDLS